MSHRTPLTLLPLGLLLTFIIYLPGLQGDFIFDDNINILENHRVHITDLSTESILQATFSGSSGPLKRPISMLSFGINHYFSGLEPYGYKLTNLIIHLLNGLGIFFLTRVLLLAYRKHHNTQLSLSHVNWISLAVCFAWLAHPINLTSVLYIVQRMTSLAALFTIAGLLVYTWGRIRINDQKPYAFLAVIASVVIFGPLAAFSKESGVLLPLYILTIELILFRFKTPSLHFFRFLIAFFTITVALPTLVLAFKITVDPASFLGGYAHRDFNVTERLLTQARVMWFYLSMIISPDTTELGIFHDDITLSTGLLNPASTVFSILGLVALAVCAIALSRRAPLFSLGLLFFLVGHSIESTILPLEIAHEHRNYLPSYGLVLLIIYYAAHPIAFPRSKRIRAICVFAFSALLAFSTMTRANQWSNLVDHALVEVAHHPNSARAHYSLGRMYASMSTLDPENGHLHYAHAQKHFLRSTEINTRSTTGLFALFILNYSTGNDIESQWLSTLHERLRKSQLLPSSLGALASFVDCQIKNICKLEASEMLAIFDSALTNDPFSNSQKAHLLTTMANYIGNSLLDYEKAITLSHEVIDAVPSEIEYHLNLIRLLIAAKQYENAKIALIKAKSKDFTGAYRLRIEAQEKLLTQFKPTTAKPKAPL